MPHELCPVDPDVFPLEIGADGDCGCPKWAERCTRGGCIRAAADPDVDIERIRIAGQKLWSQY